MLSRLQQVNTYPTGNFTNIKPFWNKPAKSWGIYRKKFNYNSSPRNGIVFFCIFKTNVGRNRTGTGWKQVSEIGKPSKTYCLLCSSFRSLFISRHTGKLFERITEHRLSEWLKANNGISPAQENLRPKNSTLSPLYHLKFLIEKRTTIKVVWSNNWKRGEWLENYVTSCAFFWKPELLTSGSIKMKLLNSTCDSP